jgi:hypothetical protein
VVSGSVTGYHRNDPHLRKHEEQKVDSNLNQSAALIINETNALSIQGVPEHQIREQRLKKNKMHELKMKRSGGER